MRRNIFVLWLLAAAMIFSPIAGHAKGGSSTGSFSRPSSSFSSSRSSFGSFSRPSGTSRSSSSSSFGSFSKPGSPAPATMAPKAAMPRSGFDSAANRGVAASSLARSQAAVNATKPQVMPRYASTSAPTRVIVHHYYSSPHDYYTARRTYYSTYTAGAPYYVLHPVHPSYGVWDGVFLGMLLTHTADAAYYNWAYAHYQTPEYRQWYQDQVNYAQQTQNAQMQQQLSVLNARMVAMENDHVAPQAPDVLPAGVNPAVALAPSVVEESSHHHYGLLLGVLFMLAVSGGAVYFIRRGRA